MARNELTIFRNVPAAIDAAASIGAASVVIDDGAGALPSVTPVAGDEIAIAGTIYAISTVTPGATEITLGITPALQSNVTDGQAVTVSTDRAVLPFNPAWTTRSREGDFFISTRTASGIHVLSKQQAKVLRFEFSGQALTAANRALINHLIYGTNELGYLGTVWLRDEVYGVEAGYQSINGRVPFGAAFTEGGKSRSYYQMPVILTEGALDGNPRSDVNLDYYWEGAFNAVELPATS